MADLIAGTEFEQRLQACSHRLTDRDLRELVFTCCRRYQDIYRFDQLENAFAYLEMTAAGDSAALQSELPSLRSEVEIAMGEYFESLNEVATAIDRLLDPTPLSPADARSCISHVWNAYACNEDPVEFRPREDTALCELLDRIANPPG